MQCGNNYYYYYYYLFFCRKLWPAWALHPSRSCVLKPGGLQEIRSEHVTLGREQGSSLCLLRNAHPSNSNKGKLYAVIWQSLSLSQKDFLVSHSGKYSFVDVN